MGEHVVNCRVSCLRSNTKEQLRTTLDLPSAVNHRRSTLKGILTGEEISSRPTLTCDQALFSQVRVRKSVLPTANFRPQKERMIAGKTFKLVAISSVPSQFSFSVKFSSLRLWCHVSKWKSLVSTAVIINFMLRYFSTRLEPVVRVNWNRVVVLRWKNVGYL